MTEGLLRTLLVASIASIALAGITIDPMPGPVYVRSTQEFTLKCKSDVGQVEWVHNGLVMNIVGGSDYEEDTKIEGSMTISTLKKSNAAQRDGGTYKCRQKGANGSYMDISVVVFDIITEDAIIEKGQDTVLQCNISGLTSYKPLFWQKDGETLDDGEKYLMNDVMDTLTIKAAVSKDAGEYVCGFKFNGSDGSQVNYTQIVNVNAKPYIGHHVTSSKNKVQGESVNLHCEVSGHPLPTVTWYKDGTLLFNGGRITLQKLDNIENASLTISDLEFEDRANYMCVATNSFNNTMHSTNSTILVRVKDKLAALWPFLGICAEVATLCAIIFIFEKKQSKDMEEEEDSTPNHDMKNSNDHKGKDEVRQRKN